jgi:DNA-binding NarL/FixJ family response regulator
MISNHDDDAFVQQSLSAGAHGFLSKTEPSNLLGVAVRTVHGNQRYFKPTVAGPADAQPPPPLHYNPALGTP